MLIKLSNSDEILLVVCVHCTYCAFCCLLWRKQCKILPICLVLVVSFVLVWVFPVDLLFPALISRFQRTQKCWYKPKSSIIEKEIVLTSDSKRVLYSVVRLCEQGWFWGEKNPYQSACCYCALQYFMQNTKWYLKPWNKLNRWNWIWKLS